MQGKTLLTITSLFDSALTAQAFREMQMVQGWGMSLDRLECVVATAPPAAPSDDVILTRTFDASRAMVFKMWTDPKHLVHWVIPKGFAPPVMEHVDARSGGSLRMTMHVSDGNVYLSQWSYSEVVEPERIVYDEVCDEIGKPFHRARQHVTFTEHPGKTVLSIRGRIDLVPDRDPRWTMDMMKAGWAEGWRENFDMLETYCPRSNS